MVGRWPTVGAMRGYGRRLGEVNGGRPVGRKGEEEDKPRAKDSSNIENPHHKGEVYGFILVAFGKDITKRAVLKASSYMLLYVGKLFSEKERKGFECEGRFVEPRGKKVADSLVRLVTREVGGGVGGGTKAVGREKGRPVLWKWKGLWENRSVESGGFWPAVKGGGEKDLGKERYNRESGHFLQLTGCRNAWAFDITAACSGFVVGLITATRFIKGGGYKNILVIGADALSRYVDWKDRGTCILFGDAAGAVLVQACSADEDGLLGFDLHSDGHGQRHLNAPTKDSETDTILNTNGAAVFPPRKATYSCIQMNGKEVFRFAVRCVPQSIEFALEEAGLTFASIDWLLLHQVCFLPDHLHILAEIILSRFMLALLL
ncbi:3-oxoacyl-[acyl-carrier-protein] synthase 3 A, chloroplastic [Dendrobium catenatum]|uniref:3-oxoacyl-[acyl-carrier-protein] synthase 3 A, chloroplastic n=1 Tax=Dendrobium catenatum TaxID=906689 RepID=A0A2I0W6Z9_9ASPA|nr:3-oxoacyl-[acyl-carrier-protein] synthase 3 A, chloroplastic [Dendrobium catenatum]